MTLKTSNKNMQPTQSQMPARQGQIFVISGPSGVGKGTLCNRLLDEEPNIMLSVSATTRKPRNGEIDGVNYYFYTAEQFERMIDHDAHEKNLEKHQLLEWAQYNGNYYGTPRQAVETACRKGCHVLLEIEIQGAFQVKQKIPAACLIFIAPPSMDTLIERLKGRGTESDAEISNRLEIARHELTLAPQFDMTVINNQLEMCLEELKSIIRTKAL